MRIFSYFFNSLIFLSVHLSAQNLTNASVKNGKVVIQFDNGATETITREGEYNILAMSTQKNIIIYAKVDQKSKLMGEEGIGAYDQVSVHCYNTASAIDVTLFTTCLDEDGGTVPDYANSEAYPFNNICGLEKSILTNSADRLYFQTSGWVTCPAIHFYDLKENKLKFYRAGWLLGVTSEGVEVMNSAIETDKKDLGNSRRYTQKCLFDFDGKLIKTLSPKEY